jgi:TonB family protein
MRIRADRGGLAVVAVLLLGTAGCATAVTPPRWATVPDGEAMGEAYPAFAADAGIVGGARLRCVAAASGKLERCRVVDVWPEGLGFDQAALTLTPRFETHPPMAGEVPRDGQVEFNILFALPPIEPIAAWTGDEPSAETLALARRVAVRMFDLAGREQDIDVGGVDEDRRAAVDRIIAQVQQESRPRLIDATALALGRTVSPANLSLLTQGQRRPPRPQMSEEMLKSAGDQIEAAVQRQNARLRELYCAEYSCERPAARRRR